MIRKLLILTCLILVTTGGLRAADRAPFTIMTQNMDSGTDLAFAIGGLLGGDIAGGVELTYQEILLSGIPQRAALLAATVTAKKPELLALQEATLWRTGPSAASATVVLYDQLQLLLNDLAANETPYDIVTVNTVQDVALPKAEGFLRFTDRNVLLIRADLRPPAFHVSDVHSNIFDAVYTLEGFSVPCGWISAMVHTGNRHFRLLTTHLESPIAFDSSSVDVQTAQAQQLLREVRNSTVPVVFAGDFNSDAILGTAGTGPDNTGTAALIQSYGYADTWTSSAGPTWPLYLEDQFPPPFVAPGAPIERIDIIFNQGLIVLGAEHTTSPGSGFPAFGSDHAGVLATFRF